MDLLTSHRVSLNDLLATTLLKPDMFPKSLRYIGVWT